MQPQSLQPLILLFDIDGTLLSSGGAGRRALVHAFQIRYNATNAFDHFDFGGMTDRAIVREGLLHLQLEPTNAEIDASIDLYLTQLEREIATTGTYIIHDGMREAVARGLSRPRCAVGLGTGNVKRGAQIKLARGKLFDHFSFGGFGCDDEDRAKLIAVGIERGAKLLGEAVKNCRVVVIGDTPKDVLAAQVNRAECVGVATGRSSAADLLAVGATAAFPSLVSPGAMAAVFGDNTSEAVGVA